MEDELDLTDDWIIEHFDYIEDRISHIEELCGLFIMLVALVCFCLVIYLIC